MDDASDPGAAPVAAAEGSLPPRKRLLLKSGSATPSAEGTPILPPKMDSSESPVAPAAAAAPLQDAAAAAAAGATTGGDSCSRCGSKDNSIWRRVKKGGVYQRLCNTCTMLYSMNMYCPYCLVVYQDAQLGDPQLWLNCAQCKRSVHVACEVKHSGSAPDPAAYSCPECRKPPTGKAEENTTTTNNNNNVTLSPTSKKPRLAKPDAGGEPGNADGETGEVKPGNAGGGVPPTPKSSAASAAHEALQQAKAAALQASKAAAQAKATALAKAQAAAKAAMAAKAALDTAAQAARDEIEARAELRRNGVRLEPRGYHALAAAAAKLDSPAAAGGGSGGENVKGKEESGPGDEELARQLHRAMNSSPRNSRGGGAPRRRGSPGASPSEATKDESLVKNDPQEMIEGGAVDTQGFPSTYLTDGGNSFPFDILAGFPSHEIQAGVIPGVTGVIGGGAPVAGTAAMEVDQGSKGGGDDEKKGEAPGVGEMGDKGDTDVSFFGAPDPKFEIPGKWSEDVKGDDEEKQQQIAVDDYTMVDAPEDPAPAPAPAPGEGEVNKDMMDGEGLQGTQTAIASEAPDAEMKVNAVAEKDVTV